MPVMVAGFLILKPHACHSIVVDFYGPYTPSAQGHPPDCSAGIFLLENLNIKN